VPARLPLSTLLSQVLVAQTIELDNEFERRLAESGESPRVTSVVMWSNFLRFVGEGIAVGELLDAAGLPKARMLSALGGMERWRYVFVAPSAAGGPPKQQRDGYGSARGLHPDWVVRPTPAGRATQEIRPALFSEIEERWEQRFGADTVGALRGSLRVIVAQADVELPAYLPIVAGSDGMVASVTPRPRDEAAPTQLTALLAQALLAYTLDFEARSPLSLALSANVIRVLGESGLLVRDLPAVAGISKEATAMALRYLDKTRHVAVDGSTDATRRARLTTTGDAARAQLQDEHARVHAAWGERFTDEEVDALRAALGSVLEHGSLSEGLRPPADGWRASKAYRARTDALLADPRATLPHHPLVVHRGGWPDGT
jgi:DNA-binding MarR family transcriptional regulator